MRKAYVRAQGNNLVPATLGSPVAAVSVKRVVGYWYDDESEMHVFVQLKPGRHTRQRLRFCADDKAMSPGSSLRYVYGPEAKL